MIELLAFLFLSCASLLVCVVFMSMFLLALTVMEKMLDWIADMIDMLDF